MALPVWGNLEKSQIDDEKIEEAIARLIQAHEDDPNAHVEAGESLNSHKASAIIDHAVISIIADKIRQGSISLSKFSLTETQIFAGFESLDGWGQTIQGAGSGIDVAIFGSKLKAGSAVGNRTNIYIEPKLGEVDFDNGKPIFQTAILMNEKTYADYGMGVGDWHPFTTNANFFGFRWIKADQKLYAVCGTGAAETMTEITGIAVDSFHLYRAQKINGSVVFYIDGVLKKTITTNLPNGTEPYFFSVGVKAQVINSYPDLYIKFAFFGQEE